MTERLIHFPSSILFHVWVPHRSLSLPGVSLSVRPSEPAVKFLSFQEQWEALTSEERSKRCLSDKEVCRSHGEHTDVQRHYLQTCFVSVFCLFGGSWHANHFPLPDLCSRYEITIYLCCVPYKVISFKVVQPHNEITRRLNQPSHHYSIQIKAYF